MICYQRESFSSSFPEAKLLTQLHYDEIAWKKDKIPLSIDHVKYEAMDRAGSLRVYTARKDNKLVGYAIFIVGRHLHYDTTLYANNDVLYVDPRQRGTAGLRLIDFSEAALKTEGVHVVILHIKTYNDWSPVAVRKGYEPTDRVFQKWIGD